MSRAPATDRMATRTVALAAALLLAGAVVAPAFAADPTPGAPASSDLRPDRPAWDRVAPEPMSMAADAGTRLIVQFRAGTTGSARRRATALPGVTRIEDVPSSGMALVATGAADPSATMAALRAEPDIADVSIDHRFFRDSDPQDEQWWTEQWGLDNTGQQIYQGEPGSEGTRNVDIDGRQALGVTEGDPNVVVAVIDDGVDFSHPDLAGQEWTNPGETGTDDQGDDKATNGIDDDGNGYVDDVHGWDFCHDDNTVHDFDDDFHGTHVAGTIAATLDGGGVVGVAPQVRIMALKFINGSAACGRESQAIAAIAYAKSFGVRIANNSWGVRAAPKGMPMLRSAIAHSGMLFVASAGNYGINNDRDPFPALPASFDLPNVLSVAAVDNTGHMPGFSDYGKKTVDISAPGVGILSSLPADSSHPEPGWGWLDGTSMAAPHVSGVAALAISRLPALAANPAALKARLLATGKSTPRTAGLTVTGRIVDALRAVDITGPTASAPMAVGFVPNSILGRTSVRSRTSWAPATDDLTSVSSYRLGVQPDGRPWSVVANATTRRSADSTIRLRRTSTFRVRARDVAGNWGPYSMGPTVRPVVMQETSVSAVYTGHWRTSRRTLWSGATTRYASGPGASVTFAFTGRAFALVAPKGPTRGSFSLFIDDAYVGRVSLNRPSSLARVLVATKTWSDVGTHSVRVVVVGTKGHPRVDVDALVLMR